MEFDDRRARLLNRGVRGGATLVAVRSDGTRDHASTQPILDWHGPIDPQGYVKIQPYRRQIELEKRA